MKLKYLALPLAATLILGACGGDEEEPMDPEVEDPADIENDVEDPATDDGTEMEEDTDMEEDSELDTEMDEDEEEAP